MIPARRLCLSILMLLPLSLLAESRPQNPLYDVEVVVFAYTSPSAGGEELWPARLVLPRLTGVLELLPPPRQHAPANIEETAAALIIEDTGSRLAPADADDGGPEPLPEVARRFELLPPSAYQLGSEAERLQRSGRYRVLWHSAWRQPGLAKDQALAIHVRAGEPTELPLVDLSRDMDIESVLRHPPLIELPGLFGETGWLEAVTGLRLPPAVLVPPDRRRVRVYPLEGSLRLEMGRYLHLYTDLILTEAVGILSGGRRGLGGARAEALQSFPVRSHRRMRSGELHHLDHPVLGLLVLTTRVEQDSSTPATRGPALDAIDHPLDDAVDPADE